MEESEISRTEEILRPINVSDKEREELNLKLVFQATSTNTRTSREKTGRGEMS